VALSRNISNEVTILDEISPARNKYLKNRMTIMNARTAIPFINSDFSNWILGKIHLKIAQPSSVGIGRMFSRNSTIFKIAPIRRILTAAS
jgi:hypothetical protein